MDDSPLHVAGKRTDLTGAAVDEAVLNSSPTILQRGRTGDLVGLQQYFTPPEAAKLVSNLHGRWAVTLDPTAGNGSFLADVAVEKRIAVEIDRDQLREIRGDAKHPELLLCADLQRAAPLMRRAGVRVPRINANPPFGLQWTMPSGERANSTVVTWHLCQSLLQLDGLGAFIAGRDRFIRDVMSRDDARAVYCIVEVPDLFDGVHLPVVLAFFTHADNRTDAPVERLTASRRELVDLTDQIRALHATHLRSVGSPYGCSIEPIAAAMKAVRNDLARDDANRSPYDVSCASRRLRVLPRPVTRISLARSGELRRVEQLDRQSISYFALNPKDWTFLLELAERGDLSLDPALDQQVAAAQRDAALTTCPMYPVRPQQRLAFLDDLDQIRCIKDDPDREFVAGEHYAISTSSKTDVRRYEKATTSSKGDVSVRKYTEEAKVLAISLGGHDFDESRESVEYLLEHFEIPDPGDLASRFPDRVAAAFDTLGTLQEGREWQYKAFQREDLARMLVKGCGLLAWEQGLGKSLGGLSLVLASIERGCRDVGLIVAPQDLVPQWQKEAEFFFGLKLQHIATLDDAIRARQHIDAGGSGLYITHFEALSLVGSRDEPLDEVTFRHGAQTLSSSEFCPSCVATVDEGWHTTPNVCGRCSYVHKRLKVPTAGSVLSGAFRDGVIVIDEGTLFKGDDSKRSKAIRGMRATHRFVLTGTPISNYVNDAFWLLWWALGDATTAFPYAYEGGRAKFEADFCVIQFMMGRAEEGKDHRRERRKVLPQVTNVSRLWRLLTGSMVRRRKEDTGEPIVDRYLKPVHVPMGTAQKLHYEHWLSGKTFESFFSWKYPKHPLVEAGLVERFAAGIGQLVKLEYATTIPVADPDREWPGALPVPLSNFTPKNMKVLELAIKHAQTGEKVLIGSCNIATGLWLAERLCEAGINAVHITEESDGKAQTMSPRKRAKVMHEFRYGDAQVLCCGIPSIRLGHNLDTASTVIINGQVFSYEMTDQFIARAHRLTSKRAVTVYFMLVEGSIDDAKWELFTQKGAAADLALDGQLASERFDPIEMDKVLRDLKRAGAHLSDNTIDEDSLEAAWREQVAAAVPIEPPAPIVTPLPVRATPVPAYAADDTSQLSLFG